MSTKTGRAPAWEMASVVAMNEFGTVTTASDCPMPAGHQGESKCVRAASHPDAELRVAKLGEVPFEGLDHRSAHEPTAMQRRPEHSDQFVLPSRDAGSTRSKKGIDFMSFIFSLLRFFPASS